YRRDAGATLADLRPIFVMLASGVSLDTIVLAIKRQTDRRWSPTAPAMASWSNPAFVREVATAHAIDILAPELANRWSKSIATADSDTNPRNAPAVQRALAELAPQKLMAASEAPTATSVAPATENTPAASPQHAAAYPSDAPTAEGLLARFG